MQRSTIISGESISRMDIDIEKSLCRCRIRIFASNQTGYALFLGPICAKGF